MKTALFVVLFAAFAQAVAQSALLVSRLPEDLDGLQALDVARKVLVARGWTLEPQDRASIEARKDNSGVRVFVSDRALRFNDESVRPRGIKQREHREEGPHLTAVPQAEIEALRADLAAAFEGKLPIADIATPKARGQVLLEGISADAGPQKVMAAARNAFIGRRWEVRNEADGVIVARIQNIDNNAELQVFLADGALRYIDRTTNRKGEKSKVPDRWLNFVRGDLQRSINILAREELSPPPREAAASPETPTERLLRLKRLLDGGLITPAEYEAKRAEILKSL